MRDYSVNSVAVGNLLSMVDANIVAIPEIQRPFVWDSIKVRDLIDSLYKEYPVGYIITWKSPNVKLKDGTSSNGKTILIDGQQRIVALSTALLGKEILDSDYQKKRIKIAFNLCEEKFETLNPAIEKQDIWIPDIAEVLKPEFNDYEFVSEYYNKFGEQYNLTTKTITDRLAKLKAINGAMIGEISLGAELDIDTVTEIFIRINLAGRALSQADFAMSKISVNEEYDGNNIRKMMDYYCHIDKIPADFDNIVKSDSEFAETEMFNKIKWVKNKQKDLYLPSYKDVLRVAFTYKFKRGKLQDLVSLLSGRDFETREYTEEKIEETFRLLKEGIYDFVNQTNMERYLMILKSAGIIEDSLVRSQNVLNFGYILYLLLKEKDVDSNLIETLVRRWVVMSIITQRYTSSPESQFDLDIRRFNEAEDIEQYVKIEEARLLNDTFWNDFLVEKFNTPVTSSPYWKTFLMAQCKLNYRGFLSKGITVRSLIEQRGDVHHIFPKNYLIKHGIKDKQSYNQIANFTMTQSEINILISDRAPNDYMNEVKEKCEGIADSKLGLIDSKEMLLENLRECAVPEEFMNMDYSNFKEFLIARRKLMAKIVRKYYESL